MSCACTPVLVGVAFSVSEIWLPFKNGQISLLGHGLYIINQKRLKKLMQVGIDVMCMHTSFGGRGFFSFGDMATFQKWPNFPFGAWTIVHGHRKI